MAKAESSRLSFTIMQGPTRSVPGDKEPSPRQAGTAEELITPGMAQGWLRGDMWVAQRSLPASPLLASPLRGLSSGRLLSFSRRTR